MKDSIPTFIVLPHQNKTKKKEEKNIYETREVQKQHMKRIK